MYVSGGAGVDCRTLVAACTALRLVGELGNLVLPAENPDHGRFFRYIRYNADLSQKGLGDLGLD